ncbi:hypothetical protein WJX81_007506 [Elliptochloris bilobata]|uniref:CxC3 like cysteine cluster domain-containing protein n=1 Tax=Elliptochloris bilobata TaxID=381761 RepID=A0AAW1RL63_9CHLO
MQVKQVAWAGVEFVDLIDVPILSCPLCKKSFAAHPLQAGCFPSTPVESSDVACASCDNTLVWFDLLLLSCVDALVNIGKHTGMDSAATIFLKSYRTNGCSHQLSWDSFRKQLAHAEYGFMLAYMREVTTGVPGYPKGLLAQCGGCHAVGKEIVVDGKRFSSYPCQSIYADLIFKASQIRSADPHEVCGTPAQANRRFMLDDKEVLAFNANPAASRAPEGSAGECSDFNAALAMGGRTSDKLRITALNREAAIERAAAVYDGRRERTLPELLIRMHVRALADVEAAGADIARMEEVLESLGHSKAQVEELLQRRAQYEESDS